MKKLLTGLGVLCLSFSLNANAASIHLTPSISSTNVGETVAVQVRISGLNDTSAPSLGVYDVDFSYDSSLFNFSTILWGDATLGNQLDLNGFGSLQNISNSLGGFNILELSFDDTADLNALQADEFTLFSVLLNAVTIGSSDFLLTANSFGDAYGNDVIIDTITNTKITVSGVAVPEPSSLLLLLGMLAVVALRTRVNL